MILTTTYHGLIEVHVVDTVIFGQDNVLLAYHNGELQVSIEDADRDSVSFNVSPQESK